MTRRRLIRRVAFCSVVPALGSLLLVLSAEALLRLVAAGPRVVRCYVPAPPPLEYGLMPSLKYAYVHHGTRVGITTDENGCRVVPGVSATGAVQVLHVVGDSQVFGWGLSDEATLPAALQRELGRSWRVVNHGVPGYGPFAYVQVIATLPPDDPVLLVFTEANDLEDAFTVVPPARARAGYLVPKNLLGEHLPEAVLSSYLLAAFTEWWVALGGGRLPLPLGYHPHTKAAAAVLEYRVSNLYAELRERRGGRLAACVIPWDASILPARLAHYRPRVTHVERHAGLPGDDSLREAFRQHPHPGRLFLEDYHLSAEGNLLVAHRLRPLVLGIGSGAPLSAQP
jgi:hypothetical protein